MKIALLTFNTAINYGAQLQAYALQKILRDSGYEAYHVMVGKRIKSTKIKYKIKSVLEKKKNESYDEFMNKRLIFYPGSFDESSFYLLNQVFDVFISGSDQVWNMKAGVNPIWFQEMVESEKKKISYAASMGIKDVPAEYISETARALSDFNYISVREDEAKSALSNYISGPIETHVDPVFLVNRSEWEELAGSRITKNPYIFVYGTEMTKQIKDAAYELKEQHPECSIISVFPMKGATAVDGSTGPIEFINYIRYADYVVTSSFHATAFSIIFHKKLVEVLHSTTGSRALNVLKVFHQENSQYRVGHRIMEWDYSGVDEIISAERKRSLSYLETAINSDCTKQYFAKKPVEIWGKQNQDMKVIAEEAINCTGCGLCVNVCSKKAIEMHLDDSGFFYPSIDFKQCVKCGICHKSCPTVYSKSKSIPYTPVVYAAKSCEKSVLMNSSSGGVFVHLSNKILEDGGVVYGCKYDKEYNAVIGRATTKEERDLFCGSKYVQSSMQNSFIRVSEDLQDGKEVLFSGVPCQVDALKIYLESKKIATDKLYSIDLICHGAPNPSIWQEHLNKIKLQFQNREIRKITFRKKDEIGNGQCLYIEFEGEKSYFARSGHDEYYRMFLKNYILRPSCYSCRYSRKNRVGDITIADWWGGYKVKPELMVLGCSEVIVNSDKGMHLFETINPEVKSLEITMSDGVQPNLYHPTYRPARWEEFQELYKKYGFKVAAWKISSKKEKVQTILQRLQLNEIIYKSKHD